MLTQTQIQIIVYAAKLVFCMLFLISIFKNILLEKELETKKTTSRVLFNKMNELNATLEFMRLQDRLNKAIENEEYEEAKKIQDILKRFYN